jgi:RES domain-containing protein
LPLDVDATVARGLWLRHTPAGADPERRPVPADDNRWQSGDVVDALYVCSDEAGVWAEWYRHLAERGIPPHASLPRDLWTYEIAPLPVADLRTSDRLARVGLPLPAPGRRTWPSFQAVGEQLRRDGFAGILVPSAARPSSLILCVFVTGPPLPDPLAVRRPPHRIKQPPAPPTGMRT